MLDILNTVLIGMVVLEAMQLLPGLQVLPSQLIHTQVPNNTYKLLTILIHHQHRHFAIIIRDLQPTPELPDYKGGGQGPATADEFKWYAMKLQQEGDLKADLTLWAGDPAQELKIRQFRSRLQIPDNDSEMPMLVVYENCKQFIRIIRDLCVDELTGEYLEPGQELHPFDESCHICMARPLGISDAQLEVAAEKLKNEAELRKLDVISRSAAQEYTKRVDELKDKEEEEEFSGEVFYD